MYLYFYIRPNRPNSPTTMKIWLGAIRMGVTGAVLFAVLALLGRLRMPNRQDAPVLISVGVFMFAIYTILTMIGLSHSQAGRAAILTFVTPLWVTPLAIVILGERLSRLKALGLVFAVGGLGVLFNPLGFDWSRTDAVIGNGLLLLASMSWAMTIIHLRIQCRCHRTGQGDREPGIR